MEHAGGANYLLRLCSMAGGIVNLREYGLIIKELSDKRRIMEVLVSAMETNKNPDKNVKEIIEYLHKDLAEMHASTSEYRLVSYENVLSDMAQDLKTNPHGRITPTGLPRIDFSMNGGLEAGKTYCIGAPPKYGKTMLKTTVANNLRKAGVCFMFVAAEMSDKQLTKRMIGADLGLRVRDLTSSNNDFVDYLVRNSMKKSNNMFYLNSPRIPLDALLSSVINAKRTKNIEGFIIDYLQLVGGKPRGMSLVEHQDEVAYRVAEICKKENLWGLYSCQLNRKGEVRNGDGILQAVEWLYELERIKITGEEGDKTLAYLKHVGTREFEELNIGSPTHPLFELSQNGTHFIHLD